MQNTELNSLSLIFLMFNLFLRRDDMPYTIKCMIEQKITVWWNRFYFRESTWLRFYFIENLLGLDFIL